MDPPPNAPRSPNGRDFAARAEGELAGLLFDPALRVAETFPIPKDR